MYLFCVQKTHFSFASFIICYIDAFCASFDTIISLLYEYQNILNQRNKYFDDKIPPFNQIIKCFLFTEQWKRKRSNAITVVHSKHRELSHLQLKFVSAIEHKQIEHKVYESRQQQQQQQQ